MKELSLNEKIVSPKGEAILAHAFGVVYFSTWWYQINSIFQQIISEEPQLKLATFTVTAIEGYSTGMWITITWDLRPWYQRLFDWMRGLL